MEEMDMSVLLNTYQSLIREVSDKNGLDPHWISAIISCESSWNLWAMRYESGYQWIYEPEKFAKKCGTTLQTEINAQKISYGLGQIMGAVAREQGHTEDLGKLFIPEINIAHIGLKLKSLNRLTQDAEAVFAGYNGGTRAMKKVSGKFSNQSYVDKVNAVLKKLNKGEV